MANIPKVVFLTKNQVLSCIFFFFQNIIYLHYLILVFIAYQSCNL